MLLRLLPILFILLWSSAFVSAKFGLPHAGPFSFLLTRFVIVAALFGGMALALGRPWPRGRALAHLMLVGVLMHGFYLGGVFFAISRGMPAGLAALIVSVQPVLTTLIAMPLLGERPRAAQWLGIALGAAGVVLVLSPRLAAPDHDLAVPLAGVASCLVALATISLGTIWQKRHGGAMDLLSGNAVQAVAAMLFYAVLAALVEPYRVEWTAEFALAMGWLVFGVSLGAVSILMLLIRSGSAAATSSLFFLVPPTAAAMGWLAFGETLGVMGVAGLLAASAGVYLVNRG